MSEYKWLPGNPANMRSALEAQPWGYSQQGGHTFALFCPMCQAMVPTGLHNEPIPSPKQQHIDWHVATAEAIARVTRLLA